MSLDCTMNPISSFCSTLQEVQTLAEDTLLLTLSRPAGFKFRPGQFLVIIFKKGQQKLARAYSIFSSPQLEGKIQLIVKLIPGGFASEIFRKARSGEQFLVEGPFGHLELDLQTQEQWFLAMGVGIVSLYCLLREYLPQYPKKKFKLFLSFRFEKDIILKKELNQMKKKYPNFRYLITLSREKWEGAQGRIQGHLGSDLLGKTFYLCGRPEAVLDLKKYLLGLGVKDKEIRWEGGG